MTKKMRHVKCANESCGRWFWSAARVIEGKLCSTCSRAEWNRKRDERTEAYASGAVIARQVLSVGRCILCKRSNQTLANGVCQDCHFYGQGDVDSQASAASRKSRGGRSDWARPVGRTE